jgi:hypothetical protein
MKNLLWVLILLLAVSPAQALAEEATASPNSEWLYAEDEGDQENWTEATDEDAEDVVDEEEPDEDESRFESALQVYGWFESQPLDVDSEKPSPDGKKFQVLDERLNTLRALEAEVKTYFSDAIAKKLMDSGVYEEIDGYLYTGAQDRAIDPDASETELTVESRTDEKIVYTLTVNHVDESGEVTASEDLTYELELIDGAWKFTKFPYYL